MRAQEGRHDPYGVTGPTRPGGAHLGVGIQPVPALISTVVTPWERSPASRARAVAARSHDSPAGWPAPSRGRRHPTQDLGGRTPTTAGGTRLNGNPPRPHARGIDESREAMRPLPSGRSRHPGHVPLANPGDLPEEGRWPAPSRRGLRHRGGEETSDVMDEKVGGGESLWRRPSSWLPSGHPQQEVECRALPGPVLIEDSAS